MSTLNCPTCPRRFTSTQAFREHLDRHDTAARIVVAQDALAAVLAHDADRLRERTEIACKVAAELLELDRARMAARAELVR